MSLSGWCSGLRCNIAIPEWGGEPVDWLDQYLEMCRDMRQQKKLEAMADEELKEATLTGRRSQKMEDDEIQDD
eukprot:symbB.v1.2.018012.t1/scaffold1375.1/size122712/4